ncbi:unnamed protein product, partial [Durusdinium trenchii]
MAKKRRARPPRPARPAAGSSAGGPGRSTDEFNKMQSAKTLWHFVKEELDATNLDAARVWMQRLDASPALRTLCREVKWLERPRHEKVSLSMLAPPRRASAAAARPGRSCAGPLVELLRRAQQAASEKSELFHSRLATESFLQNEAWSQLHSLLGDHILGKLLLHCEVYQSLGGSRYLQLTGRARTTAATPTTFAARRVAGMSARWRPSEIVIRRPILYSAHFAKHAGLPARHVLRTLPGDAGGARRCAAWILSEDFAAAGSGPCGEAEFGAARVGRKRPRGPRRSATRRANEAKGTGKPGVAQRVVKSLSPISDVVYHALLEPCLQMLKKTGDINFQQLLSKHCPSTHALIILKVFEQKSQRTRALPQIGGLRCFCQTPAAAAMTPWPSTRARSFLCTGGAAEIRFMRDFPALSCATKAWQVARFLCAAVHELLPGDDLLGRKNWQSLVKTLKLFVQLRRREELSVHDLMQNVSVQEFQE